MGFLVEVFLVAGFRVLTDVATNSWMPSCDLRSSIVKSLPEKSETRSEKKVSESEESKIRSARAVAAILRKLGGKELCF